MQTSASKLSQLQRRILAALVEAPSGKKEPDGSRLVGYYDLRSLVWGGQPATPATRAALSRALIRLEARGLIRRERWFYNSFSGRRVEVN